MAKHNVSLYRAMHHFRKGGLRQWAHSQGWKGSDDESIPQEYVDKAAASDNQHVAHMGSFAKIMGGFKH